MSLDRGGPSRTAQYVALFRALESGRPEAERAFGDPYAKLFLDPGLRAAVIAARLPLVGGLVPRYIDRRWPGPRPSAVRRTVMIDDAVRAGFADGCEQLVILGAGYDTRAYRLNELGGTPVFEVDLASTQRHKTAVMRSALGELPGNVTFVTVDFGRDDLGAAMAAAGMDPGLKTVFIWEGVLSYLRPEAIDATLGWIAGAAAPGGRAIITYINSHGLDAGTAAWTEAVRKVGEPMVTGLDPATVDAFFGERGLRLLEEEPSDDGTFYRVAICETLAGVARAPDA